MVRLLKKEKNNIYTNEIGIITSGFLPVPATKGGAVENLIVNIIKENEKENKEKITIFSIYDKKAVEESKRYQNTRFVFFRMNFFVKILDKIIFLLAKNVFRKKNSHSYRYIIQRLIYLNKVSKEISKNTYKKILLENHPTQFMALKWRKNYKKYENKYYYHCHNELNGTYGCLDIIRKTEKIICVSEYIKNVVSNYLNMEKSKFFVLRNGIDDSKFNNVDKQESLELRKKYNIKKDEKVILYIGRIVPEKGILELIKAVNKISADNFKLLIVGAALNALKNKTKYEQLIENETKKISNKVIFTGFVNYDEIPKYYNISDIAVVPSIWNDPAPLTIIEALVSGIPIITTNSGGIPEYVNNKCAIILEKDNNLSEEINKNLAKLLNDNVILKDMEKECKLISEGLNAHNYYENFIKILN